MQNQEDKSISEARVNLAEIMRISAGMFRRPAGEQWLDKQQIAERSGLNSEYVRLQIENYYLRFFASIYARNFTTKLDSRFRADFVGLHERIVPFNTEAGLDFFIRHDQLKVVGITLKEVPAAKAEPAENVKEKVENKKPESEEKKPITKVIQKRELKERVKITVPEGFVNIMTLAAEFSMNLKAFSNVIVRRMRYALMPALRQAGEGEIQDMQLSLYHCRKNGAQPANTWFSPEMAEVMRQEGRAWSMMPMESARMSDDAAVKLIEAYRKEKAEGYVTDVILGR